jgi:hypothetical protein
MTQMGGIAIMLINNQSHHLHIDQPLSLDVKHMIYDKSRCHSIPSNVNLITNTNEKLKSKVLY